MSGFCGLFTSRAPLGPWSVRPETPQGGRRKIRTQTEPLPLGSEPPLQSELATLADCLPPGPTTAPQHSLGTGPRVAEGQVLVAGDGRHIHGVLLRGAGGRPYGTLLDRLLTAASAVEAVSVLGGLVAFAAQGALAQCAPWVTVEVRLTAARLDFLHEADVTASARGGTAASGIVPAPVLHLAIGAEASVVRLPLEGPIVDLDRKGVGGLV